ncbi:MAG: lytic transglycosylase domain-containing protein, partial [Anaerolineae bacterium]|nr:lytic transglycosylase domain-containing protein [Anaerolineae bacterium]
VGTLDAPAYLGRLRFPIYYRDVVVNVANRYGFDPLLMFALIRHESFFETSATAAAGEKGLTQVIPPTGAYIAEQIAWRDYEHSDLFRPYAGIEFGAFYLAEQLNLFDGNVYAALGAYNAGPGRGLAWLEASGGDPDRFMAAITISSTRTYIQRIYNNYAMYRALYGMG